MSPLCFELRAVCQTWSELRAVSQTAFNLKRAFSQISNMARPTKQQDEDLKELLSISMNKNGVLESSSLIKNLFRDFLVNLWGKNSNFQNYILKVNSFQFWNPFPSVGHCWERKPTIWKWKSNRQQWTRHNIGMVQAKLVIYFVWVWGIWYMKLSEVSQV